MPEQEYLVVEHLSIKDIARIFSKIKVNPETGCWEWVRALNAGGYAQISFRGRRELVHRILYAWTVEPLPRAKRRGQVDELDHIVCDNRRCVNPIHVKLVSPKANTLRGTSPAAQYARRTHCKNGHPFPEGPNRAGGGRRCTLCRRTPEQLEMHREAQRRYVKGPKREEILARQREHNREHYEGGKEYHRQYSQKWDKAKREGPDREAYLARKREIAREWRKRNPDKVREHNRRKYLNRKAKT